MSNRAQRRDADRLARQRAYQNRTQPDAAEATADSTVKPVPDPTHDAAHNATRHGCCALEILILPTEKITDFEALEIAWFHAYKIDDEAAAHLIDLLVAADWLHQRSVRTLAEVEAKIFAAEPDPLLWTDNHHKALTRFQRYRTANQNAFNKARKAIDDYVKTRTTESHQAERLTIHKARLQAYELKHKPEPTWDEIMEDMKRISIEKGYSTLADYPRAAPGK